MVIAMITTSRGVAAGIAALGLLGVFSVTARADLDAVAPSNRGPNDYLASDEKCRFFLRRFNETGDPKFKKIYLRCERGY